MWSSIDNRSGVLNRLMGAVTLMGLCAVLGLPVIAPNTAMAQNLKYPPALEIFARPDAVAAPALSADASHAYYISRKGKIVSLIDHNLVAKTKVEIPLLGAAQFTTSITPLDSYRLLLSYPAPNGKLMGSIVNMGTRKLAPLSYNAQPISYGHITVYQGAMGPTLSVIGHAGASSVARFDYDPVMDKMNRTALETIGRDLWLSQMGEAQFAEALSPDGQTWSLKGFTGGSWRDLMQSPIATAPKILGPGREADSLYLKASDGQISVITIDGAISPVDTTGKLSPTPVYSRSAALGLAFADDWPQYQFDAPEAAALPALAAKTFADYRIVFIDFAADPRRCLIRTEGQDDAGTYYFVDFANDEYVELGKTRPALRDEWISEKDAFTYRSADGADLKAYLTLPPGREPHGLPLVALVSDDPVNLGFDPLVAGLATRGYAVLQANGRTDKPSDLMDAVAYLKTNGVIDDKRVCLIGKGLKRNDERCAIDSAPLYVAATPEARLKPLKAMVDILTKDNAPY